jgi:7-cyano-7-deazaguanine synthase
MPVSNQPAVALLLSGGLDSAILLSRLLVEGHWVRPIYIRTNAAWEPEELTAVDRYLSAVNSPRCEVLVTLQLPLDDLYGDHWSITGNGSPDDSTPDEAMYLPGRNPLLLVKAAVWCQMHGIDELALATLSSNPFSDATDEFFAAFEGALALAGQSVQIVRPFAALHKRDVMLLGRRLPLQHTFSCIAAVGGLHCGRCNKCAERKAAFAMADMADPTVYADSRQTPHAFSSSSVPRADNNPTSSAY